jgi:ankyrin repeat protein
MERISKADLTLLGGRSASLGDSSEILPRRRKQPSSFKSPFQDDSDNSDPTAILTRLAHRPFLHHKEDLASSPIPPRTTLHDITFDRAEKVQEAKPRRSIQSSHNHNAALPHKGKTVRQDSSLGHDSEPAPKNDDNEASDLAPSEPNNNSSTGDVLFGLINACRDNRLGQARRCDEQFRSRKYCLNTVIYKGQTLLHIACLHDDANILKFILPQFDQSSLNPTDNKGQTPLALALSAGKYTCAEVLLNLGADPFISIDSDEKISSLIRSRSDSEKAINVLRLLLEARRLRRRTAKGILRDHQASQMSSATSELSPVSLNTGLEATSQPSFHMHYTISEDHSQGTIQTILARFGAQSDQRPMFSTWTDSEHGEDSGKDQQDPQDIDTMIKNAEALFMAGEYPKCASLCSKATSIAHHASVDQRVVAKILELEGRAFERSDREPEAIRSYQKSLNAHPDDSLSRRLKETTRVLLAKNDAKQVACTTILMSACSTRNIELVKFFYGLNPDHINEPDDNGWTPLHYAAAYGSLEIVKYLLRHNALIEGGTTTCETPLALAVQYARVEHIAVLLHHGANSQISDPSRGSGIAEAAFEQAIYLLRHARAGTEPETRKMEIDVGGMQK